MYQFLNVERIKKNRSYRKNKKQKYLVRHVIYNMLNADQKMVNCALPLMICKYFIVIDKLCPQGSLWIGIIYTLRSQRNLRVLIR